MSTPNSLPTIAIFVPSSAIGGAEHYIKNILHLIVKNGFQPTLILPKNSQIVDFFSALDTKYLVSDIAWSGDEQDLKIGESYLNKLTKQYRAARRILEFLNPDCAFINLPWLDFGLGISLACHDLQIPATNLVHLCPWKVKVNDLTKQIFQNLALVNSNFFTVSNDNRIQLSLSTGISLDLIKVFYNSRDVESKYTSLTSRQHKISRLELLDELELPINSFLSVSVGRFSHQKNFLDIITTFSSIHDKLPNYYHLFLGEGELQEYYQKIAQELGLSDKLKFLGYRRDVDRFLALSDLFISSSLYEGLALSILEAAQFSCPIIAANSSSAQEIIPNSEYGLLYNPGQYNSLAEHIEFACFNHSKMKQKAENLKYLCQQKFSLRKFNNDLKTILNHSVMSKISNRLHLLPVFYDLENKRLKIDQEFETNNYQQQTLPKVSTQIAEEVAFPFQEYCQQVLERNHDKYLHSLRKLSKMFFHSKIILCFGSFNANFFRNYYLKEKYLLIVISQETDNRFSLNFHPLNHTYWGQDIEPDCLAKYTIFDRVSNLAELDEIDSEKTNYKHYYTSKRLLDSYWKSAEGNQLDNLAINLKIINNLFKPIQYYLLEQDSNSNKVKMRLAN